MRLFAWNGSALLALAAMAGTVAAAGDPPLLPPLSGGPLMSSGTGLTATRPVYGAASVCPPIPGSPFPGSGQPSSSPGMPGSTSAPGMPGSTSTPGDTTSAPAAAEGSGLGGMFGSPSGQFQGNVAASGAGLTAATSAATAATGTGSTGTTGVYAASTPGSLATGTHFTVSQTPLILPGLFTAVNAESARPMDRVFMSYGYFDHFNVSSPAGIVPGFNLNRFDIGGEKTFLDGQASVYVRVPFLYATDNSSGQPIDGLGDISVGLKFVLLADAQTGSTLSGGMTVSAPTARNSVVTTTTSTLAPGSIAFSNLAPVPGPTSTTVNPTFIQPWTAGVLVLDRLFVQDYLGVVVPTDSRTATFINNDVGVGYQVYRNPGSLLSSVTPTLDAQLLLPLNHQGTPAAPSGPQAVPTSLTGTTSFPTVNPPNAFNSPYQVFVTGGVGFGLGSRSLLSIGVTTPVTGPKAFSTGGSIGFNYFF